MIEQLTEMAVPEPSYCLFGAACWQLCLTKAEWAAWVQAAGSILALCIAIGVPLRSERRAAKAARKGNLQLIALDVALAEAVTKSYLNDRYKIPAYRIPLRGDQGALSALIAAGEFKLYEANALADFYMHVASFNRALDLAQEAKSQNRDCEPEIRRARNKARGLQRDHPKQRIQMALTILTSRLDAEEIEPVLTPDADEDEVTDGAVDETLKPD